MTARDEVIKMKCDFCKQNKEIVGATIITGKPLCDECYDDYKQDKGE